MNHYTYEIEFSNGMKYIGVRSCKCSIEDDSYLGSSKVIPPELYATCVKNILKVFNTRIEALQHEIKLHSELDVANNTIYYNQVNQSSVKFNQQGTSKSTHEHIKRMADKLKDRSKKEYTYLEDKSKKASARRGSNRTEAQKKADLNLSYTQLGVCNPAKGLTGSDSPKFKPWYYITPEGKYYEVYTSIRNFCSNNNPLPGNYRQVSHAVSARAHMPALKGSLKDWVFGYIHDKPSYLTQENIAIALNVLLHLPFQSPNKETPNRPNLISNITGKK